MQQVSFPDINKSPTEQAVVPPMKMIRRFRHPGTARLDRPEGRRLHVPPRPVLWMKSPDGTAKNQMGKDEGPLTLERSKTVDEEISSHVIDFLDRNDPKKTNKPFFCYYNPARMHITTVFSPKYEAMVGTKGGKDWGINEVGMKQMDDNIGVRAQEAGRHGRARQHDRRVHHRQRRRDDHLPRWRRHAVQGQKAHHLGRRHRAPCVIRWPGVHQAGHGLQGDVRRLDWLPTFVEIAGGPKGNELNKQIQAGKYKDIVKTKLDGFNQLDYLKGKATIRSRHVLLLLGCDSVGRALQEL